MPPIRSKPLTPILKWVGGKRWLVPLLQPAWARHKHRRLVEPFAGGLSVALGLQPLTALLNDKNPHLINLYRRIQVGFTCAGVDMRYEPDHYYACRDRFNDLIRHGQHETAEAAALFMLLNKTGFNGLVRFNRSGFFNVPVGKYKSVSFLDDFSAHQHQFTAWQFSNEDFSHLELNDDMDFLYIDSPYDSDRSAFTDYTQGGFVWADQVRLAEWVDTFKGPVIVSNAATKRIITLYRDLGFRVKIIDAPRAISCNGDRQAAKEILASRNLMGK